MLTHPAFDLDWNLVRTFVAVASEGSLAGGARALGITHPTAARHIQLLEESLGMALFSRTSQGLILNDAGQRLDRAAQRMHKSALAFQATSDTVREAPVQAIRISVAEVLAELLPPVMLPELLDRTDSALTVDMVVTNDVLNILDRDADIALRNVRPEQHELLCKKLGSLDMGVFASSAYVAEHGLLSAESVARHRFIDGLSRDYLTRGAAQRGLVLDKSQIVLRTDSMPCQRAALKSGWGIAAMPIWMAQREPDWVSAFAEDEVIDLEVWLVARPEVRDSEHMFGIFTRLGEGLAACLNAKS